MSNTIVVAVLAGTTRESRKSINAAKLVASVGREFEAVDIEFVDPRDFNFPNDGEEAINKDPKYSAITARADAFFIVSPEYNHGYPGSLKRMLDSEYTNYKYKPVALAGVSDGQWGGTRVVEALLPVVRTLQMFVIPKTVYFPLVQDTFDEQGNLIDQSKIESIQKAFSELIWLARIIKDNRQ